MNGETLVLTHLDESGEAPRMVDSTIDGDHALIDCHVPSAGQTGMEMEVPTGASVAALTIYDMCKALTHEMVIREGHLVAKRGERCDFGNAMP